MMVGSPAAAAKVASVSGSTEQTDASSAPVRSFPFAMRKAIPLKDFYVEKVSFLLGTGRMRVEKVFVFRERSLGQFCTGR